MTNSGQLDCFYNVKDGQESILSSKIVLDRSSIPMPFLPISATGGGCVPAQGGAEAPGVGRAERFLADLGGAWAAVGRGDGEDTRLVHPESVCV